MLAEPWVSLIGMLVVASWLMSPINFGMMIGSPTPVQARRRPLLPGGFVRRRAKGREANRDLVMRQVIGCAMLNFGRLLRHTGGFLAELCAQFGTR